jgi:hypothetical protein
MRNTRPEIRLFEVNLPSPGEGLVVFARSLERAVQIARATATAPSPGMQGAAWDATDEWATVSQSVARHTDSALRRRIEGIGVFDPDDGWRIAAI